MKKLKFLTAIFAITLLSCNHDDDHITQNPVVSVDDEIIMCTFDFVNSHNVSTSKPNAAILNSTKWLPERTIKIKFLDGDIDMQEQVKKYASEWMTYANLKFEYVPKNEYADIKIGFTVGSPGGAWSILGTGALSTKQDQPSMRFGWNKVGNEESAKRTILHEFGHALGLVHEQNSPVANINWNLPKVYKYYYDNMDWSKEKVDENVIYKYSPEQTNYSVYDPLSIMHYYIDPNLTTDGIRVDQPKALSKTDMISINKWYPFPIVSSIESGTNIHEIPWTNSIKSPSNQYELEFSYGYLSVYDNNNNKTIWQVGDHEYSFKPTCSLELNGNIVIQGRKRGIIPGGFYRTTWTSNTAEFPGAKLHLQNDGNLVLIHNGIIRWSSKNGKL
ncbi:matrixin family metalloprotease [Flavobacterium soyae]|uniref:Matrixin family metalloprotease n=1 Tax=Flavobacterium soyae TaxID=2903098 RepID=A0ABZ2UL22_9FLAO